MRYPCLEHVLQPYAVKLSRNISPVFLSYPWELILIHGFVPGKIQVLYKRSAGGYGLIVAVPTEE